MSNWTLVKGALGAAVLGFALFTAAPANANFILSDGTDGFVTNVGANPNDALTPLGFPNTLNGQYGANVSSDGAHTLKYEFFGFEAGFINQFFADAALRFATTGGTSFGNLGTYVGLATNGLLDFSFVVTDTGLSVVNGANLDDSAGGAGLNPNFFVHAALDGSVWLFLDDGGGNDDDNHDDMVIRISQVPEPGTLALLGLGLLGLGATAIRRRRLVA